MRICSLVPGATEVVAALGQADCLVGISHECDYPSAVRHAAVLIEPQVSSDAASSSAIDRQVRTLVSTGQPLYRLNVEALTSAAPDVVLTQDLCHVCAVTTDQLSQAVRSLSSPPELLTLNPTTLDDVLSDVERIGAAVGCTEKARNFALSLRRRLAAVTERTATNTARPRVLCLEWLSPLFIGGHWIPDMIQMAGGTAVLSQPARPSCEVTWDQVASTTPDIVILMPCGFSVERTWTELASLCRATTQWSKAIESWPAIFVVDAASYFSRPGPRLVDGVELLAAIFFETSSIHFDETIVRRVLRNSFM